MRMLLNIKTRYALTAVIAGLGSSSCSSGALEELRAINPATSPSPYYLALSRHYLHYAESLRHRNNGIGSDIMAKRGIDALRMPPPALPPETDLLSTEQQQARAFIAYTTGDPGLQRRLPDEVAQLRWLYDCWEYESSKAFGTHLTAECRSAYYALADKVFSAFAPGHIEEGAKKSVVTPVKKKVKIHPLLSVIKQKKDAAVKTASLADDAPVKKILPSPKVITPSPPPPSREELAQRAEDMNPFLSIAERNAILDAEPMSSSSSVPRVFKKPAVKQPATTYPIIRKSAVKKASVKRPSVKIAPVPRRPAKTIPQRGLLDKRLHIASFSAVKDVPTPKGAAYVAKLGKALARAKAGDYRITVNGFSDSAAGDAANMQLSLQRALSVKKALIAAGVEKSTIDAFAYGDKWTPESAGTAAASYGIAEIIITKK